MKSIARVVGSFVLCLLALAPPLFAQSAGSSRPFRGLFGGAEATAGVRHSMDVAASIVQAYDDNLLAERGGINPARGELGGHFTMLLINAGYRWQGRRMQVGMTGSSVARYYGGTGSLTSAGHSAGIGFSAPGPMRTSILVNQTAAYSPAYLYLLFPDEDELTPGDSMPLAADYSAHDFESYLYQTVVSLRRDVTRRGTVVVRANYRFTDASRARTENSGASSYSGVRAQFSRAVSRHQNLSVSYRYRAGSLRSWGTDIVPEHGVEIGYGVARPISPTRRASFEFGFGTSFVDRAVPTSSVTDIQSLGRYYRATGGAALSYELNRTWDVRARYLRGVNYLPQTAEPVFSDGFRASIGGALSRNAIFSASAGYSRGASAAYRESSTFDTYTGTLQLQYAVGRYWAAYTQYLYYYYDFSGNPQVARGRPPVLERHGVRVGLTLRAPVLRR